MNTWTDKIDHTTRFHNCPAKEYIHDSQYAFITDSGIRSSVMMVTGPNVKRHVLSGLPLLPKNGRILIVELDGIVYAGINSALYFLRDHHKFSEKRVVVVNANVSSYTDYTKTGYPYRIEDIDLCKTFGSIKGLIYYRLFTQANDCQPIHKNKKKCMAITSSTRTYTKLNSLKDLNEVLSIIGAEININATMSSVQRVQKGVKKYDVQFKTKGRLDKIELHTYREDPENDGGTPMFTVIFSYI